MSSQVKTIIVTGGAGFIGSNFILHLINNQLPYKIINLDCLTYAGNLENLKDIEQNPNYLFVKGNVCNKELIRYLVKEYQVNGIINFAAESHVDRSILGPNIFLETNIHGTLALLEIVKELGVERFLQVSTDEVYGSLESEGYFTEEDALKPNNPYSVSKASSDMLVRAYYKSYSLPVIITRCSNNYGQFQFPEKLIPLMIINALNDKELPVYGDGKNIRDWLHVKDHCRALLTVYEKGKIGEVYNIGGHNEWQNIDIVKLILNTLNKSENLIRFVKDRIGHDRRYAIDPTKIKNQLGWKPEYKFDNGIRECIDWYIKNKSWWEKIISGEYQNYYMKNYGDR